MLLSGGPGLFVDGRLFKPMGYVNGEAGFLLILFWCLAAEAERRRRPALRGAATALAVMTAELLVLTQSRAIVPALLFSALLVLVVAPGRVARGSLLLVMSAAVAAALPTLLDVYASRSGTAGRVDARDRADGRDRCAGHRRAGGGGPGPGRRCCGSTSPMRGRAAFWPVFLVSVPLVAVVAGLSLAHDPEGWASRQYHAFVSNRELSGELNNRFVDVGGFRYDLWRVAVREWRGAPVEGLGAGNYDTRYYVLRRNPQYVRQPHSIELQALAELGLAGALGMLAVFGGIAWAGLSAAVRRRDFLILAALGGTTVWLLHTSVDWVYNLPGVTGVAILLAAVLLRDWTGDFPPVSGGRRVTAARVATAVVAVAVVAVTASTAAAVPGVAPLRAGQVQPRPQPRSRGVRGAPGQEPESGRSRHVLRGGLGPGPPPSLLRGAGRPPGRGGTGAQQLRHVGAPR